VRRTSLDKLRSTTLRHIAATSAVAAICLVLSSCTATPPPNVAPAVGATITVVSSGPTTPVTSTSDPVDSPSLDASTEPRKETIGLEVVDGLGDWFTVVEPNESIYSWTTHNAGWTVVADVDGVLTASHEGQVTGIPYPDGYDIVDIRMSGDRLVVVDAEPQNGDYHVTVHDLNEGTFETIEEWDGHPQRHDIPYVAVDDNTLVWTTWVDDDETCLLARDLDTNEETSLACSPTPGRYLRLPTVQDGSVTYRLDTIEPEPCMELLTIDLPGGQPAGIGHAPCQGFFGHAVGDLAVWTEMSIAGGDVSRAPLFAADSNGNIWDLGHVGAGSTVMCEDRFFWRIELVDYVEIRTWAPGEPVTVVFRSEPDWYPVSSPSCSDGWVTIANAYVGVGPVVSQVLAIEANTL